MPEILIKDRISMTIIGASVSFAKRAVALSQLDTWKGVGPFTNHHDAANRKVMEQTIGAVVLAVAGLEGMINEILAEASEGVGGGLMSNVTAEAYARWGRSWINEEFDMGNALERSQAALKIAGLSPLPEGDAVVESTKALIDLRNHLVHLEPKFRPHGKNVPAKQRDSLEKSLRSKFQPNSLVPPTSPYIWQRCLGVSCARWSVETANAFKNQFFAALGIPIRGEIVWEPE